MPKYGKEEAFHNFYDSTRLNSADVHTVTVSTICVQNIRDHFQMHFWSKRLELSVIQVWVPSVIVII